MKRRLAIGFLAVVLLLVAASLALLRTPWAGRELCRLAAIRVRASTGLTLELGSCRVDPLRLAVEARDVRLGPPGAEPFRAEAVRLRLAPVQALGGALDLAAVELTRPRVVADLPARDPSRPAAACPPPALSRVRIDTLRVSEGSLDLVLPGGERVRAGRIDVQAVPGAAARGLRQLAPGARRIALRVEARDLAVDGAGRSLRVDAAGARLEAAMDLSAVDGIEAWAEGAGARVEVRGAVATPCRPVLDLRVSGTVPLRTLLDAAGRPGTAASGTASASVHVTGPPARLAVEGEARLERARISAFTPGDATVRFRWAGSEVQVERAEVAAAGGPVVAQGKVRIGKTVAVEGEARLEGTELGDVLGRFGLPGAWVSMRVRGEVKGAGTAWPLALHGTGALDLADFRVLGHAWDRPRAGERPILAFARGRLDTRVAVGPDGVRLEDARLAVGRESLTAQARLAFAEASGFSVDFAGGVDLGELGHVGGVPMAGRAVVVGGLGAAPYGNPRIHGTVRARDLRFLQLDLGEAGAELSTAGGDDLVLRVAGVDGRRGETRYTGQVDVDLGASPPRITGGGFEARGRLRDLFEGAMPWLPEARVARDALDAPVQAEASLQGPADAPDVDFTARLGPGSLLERPFDAGEVSGRIERGRRAVFERLELRRESGAARGSGWVGLARPFPWELEASAAGLPLEALGLPGGRWAGRVSGQAQLGGSWEEPLVRFSGNGDGVSALGVPVGTVQVGGALQGPVLSLTGSTEGVKFSGQARTDGDMPFEARADVDVEDVTRFFPGGPPAGLRARARGVATAEGVLADVGAARSELSFGDLQVSYADFRVQNRDPVRIATAGGRIEVRSFTLVGVNTELSVTGARERDGRLSLATEGSLDLRLLGGLLPGVARPHGGLQLEARVSGTTAEPLLVGSGRLRDAGFQVKDLPVTFAAMSGDLAFSQNRIVFDHLPATVNGGRAELDGELELQRLVPTKVRATARLEEVPVRIPANLPSVVSGQLSASGTWDSMLLSGRLEVLRALYTERVDLERSLLEWKRRAAAPRGYDRGGEWLRFDVQLVLDGDIRIENDLVRGGVRGELTLTGTLGSLGMVGSVTMTPGSLVTFRGHDFLLSHAVVDLTERRRIRPQMDVHGEAQVRDYQILMHAYGSFDDPQLQLSSVPALSQEDIFTLLSMGITSRDSAFTGGGGGVAIGAAAAQALFAASGLDEQVRRFLPRGSPLQDFTFRITSAYSEGTGQVVPKAEFESKLDFTRLGIGAGALKDWRLRYQAPVSGVAKGQKAQLEWRPLPRTSLFLQWDNESPDTTSGGDWGADLRFRLEWTD